MVPLSPFKHPFTGEDFMSADTFRTEEIGYKYDTLPRTSSRRNQMREMPSVALFEQARGWDPRPFTRI